MYKVAWFAEYTLVSSLNHLSWIISSMSIQFDVVYINLQSTEKRCDVDKRRSDKLTKFRAIKSA